MNLICQNYNKKYYLSHHKIPRECDSVPLVFSGVIFLYRLLKKHLHLLFSWTSVNCGQNNGSDLQKGDDNDKEAISGQKNAGLFDSSTVAKKTYDEDKCTHSNKNVSTLFNYSWLRQLSEDAAYLIINL